MKESIKAAPDVPRADVAGAYGRPIEYQSISLEEKIDACLVLLSMATSHDGFVYTLNKLSDVVRASFRRAIAVATSVETHVGFDHPECTLGHPHPSLGSASCTSPSETGGNSVV